MNLRNPLFHSKKTQNENKDERPSAIKDATSYKIESEDERLTKIIELAKGYFQILPSTILVAAANGKIDLNALALAQLASRGLDRDGNWQGYLRTPKAV